MDFLFSPDFKIHKRNETMASFFSLEGSTAVVTGATRGIGQAVAIGLAEAGADIILIQVGFNCRLYLVAALTWRASLGLRETPHRRRQKRPLKRPAAKHGSSRLISRSRSKSQTLPRTSPPLVTRWTFWSIAPASRGDTLARSFPTVTGTMCVYTHLLIYILYICLVMHVKHCG